MKSAAVLLALLLGGLVLPAGTIRAADEAAWWRAPAAPAEVLPFPRGKRADAVWAGGACWSECGSYCAWGLAGCLERDPQGRCLKLTDRCDRYCQRQCRTRGGPYVPIDTLFPFGD